MKKWIALSTLVVSSALAACSSGGMSTGGSTPQLDRSIVPMASASVSPSPAPTLPATLVLGQGKVDGQSGHFTPSRGDGPMGGVGQTVDNVPCLPSMVENQFHVHSFVGLIVYGNWYALPDSIGEYKPGPLYNGYSPYASVCYYEVHTHDQSGYVHQEAASSTPQSGSVFKLGQLLDIWGVSLTSTSFYQWPGTVRVFTARAPSGQLNATPFTEYLGDPTQIPFYSHEAVWIEVGPPFVEAANLPIVRFYTQY